MKLASRMDRILIETAFEVLVKARALEAQGKSVIHLEIGEPDFDTPHHVVEAANERSMRAGHITARRRAIRICAKCSRSMSARRAASRLAPSMSASCPAASRSSSSRCWR